VTLTATITDNDGDQASSGLDLGPRVTFLDDGPTAPTVTASGTVGVDETPGVQTTGGASDVLGSTAITFNGASTTVAALFATVANKGLDTDVPAASLDNGALSFASSGLSSIVSIGTLTYGADGPAASGAEKIALAVTNTSSGLTLTDGTAITLSLDASGRVIGTVGSDAANPSLTGKVAFAIAMDPVTGELYVVQYLSLHQDNLSNTPNDLLSLAAGSVGVTVTLTDADGDSAVTTTDISSHVSFLDDGPTIGTTLNAVIASINGSDVQGTWQPTFGADGPSTTAGIGITIPTGTIGGLTYTVTDTGTHNAAGEEIFSVKVAGGANTYTFFEYTHYNAATQTDEMFAYATQADAQAALGNNEFFTLSMAADGTYDFHLVSNSLQTFQSFNFTTLPPGNSDYATITNGVFTAHSGNDSIAGANILIDGFDTTHTDPNVSNKVFINNGAGGGLGVNNGNLDTGETVLFKFNNIAGDPAQVGDQTSVTIGIGKGNNSANESFQITIWNDAHTVSSTETVTQADGTAVTVDAAHWTGAQPFFAFGEVDVENIGGTAGFTTSDNKVLVTSISGATVISSTTLNFTPTITDGDGDTATGSNFSVALTSNPDANGGFTLVGGTGNDVLLSSSHVDTMTGGGGSNTFEFNNPHDGGGQGSGATITTANTDQITDFNVATDTIAVSAANFAGVTFGEVFNGTQVVNAPDNNFTNAAQRFLFDQGNHTLYFSPDGTTAHEQAIAILNLVAAINPANIHVAH
jgi:Domain of unknown function (DUF5801)